MTKNERERLYISILFALFIYGALFFSMHFILQINIQEMPEYTGPIFIEIDGAISETIIEPAEKSLLEETITEPAAETSTEAGETRPESTKSEATAPPQETSGEEPILPETEGSSSRENGSLLEEDNLSELDRLLEQGSTSESTTETEKGDGDGGLDSGTKTEKSYSIEWEDNSKRQVIYLAKPEIPEWVSKQGITLRGVYSFSITADGFVIDITVVHSCGYPDVDTAIKQAIARSKFVAVSGSHSVRAEITYIINPR